MKILLTGVSRGLGEALCHEFDRLGHEVAGCARDANAIDKLKTSMGSQHHFSTVDLQSDSDVKRWIQQVCEQWGTPELVINNAGIINSNAPLWEVPLDEFERVINVNITAVYSVIRHIVPQLLERGSGVIANLSSGWGRSVSAEVAPYCASKWGVEGLTQALAQELPNGIAAVPVNPGVINTDMLQSCFGPSASDAPTPAQWAKKAAPFFLQLSMSDNGQQRSV